MLRHFFFLSLLLVGFVASAQSYGRIEGVVHGPDGNPLAEVEIFLEKLELPVASFHSRSDSNGEFHFDKVPPGEYKLTLKKPYLMSWYQGLTVTEGKTQSLFFAMEIKEEPAPTELGKNNTQSWPWKAEPYSTQKPQSIATYDLYSKFTIPQSLLQEEKFVSNPQPQSPTKIFATTGKLIQVRGIVYSPEGEELPNVKVSLLSEALLSPLILYTEDDGGFSVGDLPPGRYNLRAEQPGLKVVTQKGIVVNVERTISLYITMEIPTDGGCYLGPPPLPPVSSVGGTTQGFIVRQSFFDSLPR